MFKSGIETVSQINKDGDILSVFKPLRETLSSHYSKSVIPLNLFNRKNRRIAYGILEVIVESKGTPSEWKLKLDNINITRQFKPTYSMFVESENKNMYKFVYDITSILNTSDIVSKEWINLFIKYEGGDSFTVRAILLDAIYEDSDAKTLYEHGTGLVLIESGKTYKYPVKSKCSAQSIARIISYATKKTKVELRAGSRKASADLHQDSFDEYVLLLNETPEYIEIINTSDPGRELPIVISSITVYENIVKQPVLEVCGIEYSREPKALKLFLDICNKGDASPDKLIISILRKGNLVSTIQDSELKLQPGQSTRRSIELPVHQVDELQVRLIWFKLTKRWLRDEVVKLA
ncbi:MAG: hypothetical protein QW816_00315 [Desulfurococcaceae archaeon]